MTDSMWSHYYNKGLIACKNNNLTLAVKTLSTATDFNPNHPLPWNLLGLCYYRIGQFRMAQYTWEKSITLQPYGNDANDYLEILRQDLAEISKPLNVVFALCESHNYAKACAIFENEIMISFDEIVDILNFHGVLKFLTNHKKQALESWRKALLLDQQNEKASLYIREMALMRNPQNGFFKKILFWDRR
ncbi:tetratricopeptide repeat protein [Fusibacter sp. 3D3]|uniref:tetratricopeptide repeat protein n=1 Tax=Fusibacter sp. 3D3 TaxID=1048380 RepID=UPI000852CB8A|nr:tetratricopeptide repeat protein [Fusibacter sp. 3D3]GAU77729.1 conserved protein [Fusibacter sp. 3D3]